ncbi:hypothetical protein SMC1_09750 [Candidatus Cryosericum septentrionale]|jgi:hypothetical protein|uniref:Uncharacterized protein n=1 Tax=Candidatus Cryosericum septentrionale TaxID=2290913 RepID=A0A398DJ04_9BACT|nr:hypothetical protein SMC1_09750 [Candidatus Cryosericum septentrionale]
MSPILRASSAGARVRQTCSRASDSQADGKGAKPVQALAVDGLEPVHIQEHLWIGGIRRLSPTLVVTRRDVEISSDGVVAVRDDVTARVVGIALYPKMIVPMQHVIMMFIRLTAMTSVRIGQFLEL